jgi:hypothetical protein
MADDPYLVCLALVQQGSERRLPVAGQSWSAADDERQEPGDRGRALALELLLRLWQRSDEGALARAAGDPSLLLLEMPLEQMSERLPLIKAAWLRGGSTEECLAALKSLASRGWWVGVAKYEPVTFHPWG